MDRRRRRQFSAVNSGPPPIDPLVKPIKWAVTAAGVATGFQSAWTNMEMLFPIWDGSGNPVDVVSGSRTLVLPGDATYTTAPDGAAVRFPSGNFADTSTAASSCPPNRSLLVTFTMTVFPTGDNFKQLWGIVDGGAWLANFGCDDRGIAYFYEVAGGRQDLFSAGGKIVLGARNAIVCVANNSVGMKMFLNGVQIGSNGITGFLNFGGLKVAANNNRDPYVGTGADWKLSMGGYWTRALSDVEAVAISADPYGLVRAK